MPWPEELLVPTSRDAGPPIAHGRGPECARRCLRLLAVSRAYGSIGAAVGAWHTGAPAARGLPGSRLAKVAYDLAAAEERQAEVTCW